MPSIGARTTYFGAFTTPSRLALRKAFKYRKSNPVNKKARRIKSRKDCRAKLRAGLDRNVARHASRNSEVWRVLSSAIDDANERELPPNRSGSLLTNASSARTLSIHSRCRDSSSVSAARLLPTWRTPASHTVQFGFSTARAWHLRLGRQELTDQRDFRRNQYQVDG